MKKNYLLMGSIISTAVLLGTNVFADSAADIETYASGTAATYDDNGTGNYPIVDAILTAPHGSVYNPTATLDGYTYNNWSYLVGDTTGSLDVFYSATAAGPLANYPVPTVGNTVEVQGTWSPFDGIPEIGNGTQAINVFGPGSTGNTPYSPVPAVSTIPTINVGTNSEGINASGFAGQLIQLDNVTISGTGTNAWAFHANVTGTITDVGGHSMTMFLWASSYSDCGAIAAAGGAIPTGPVDMEGFVDDFSNAAEFVPTSIIAVPEPTTLGLCGAGALIALAFRSRK